MKQLGKGMKNIEKLYASNNQFGKDLEGTDLNPISDSLSNFSKATLGKSGKYTFSKILQSIGILDLSYNPYLKRIDYLEPLDTIYNLYLDHCDNLENSSVVAISNRINSAATTIGDDYLFYLASLDNTILKLNLSRKNNEKDRF